MSKALQSVGCVLCDNDGGELIWRDQALRIIFADEPEFPGFTRLVWRDHQREMSDLEPAQRARLMDAVFLVESVMRNQLQPDKINLASLGNQVAHLHWHVIPRWTTDSRFPAPVWAPAEREGATPVTDSRLSDYRTALLQAFKTAS